MATKAEDDIGKVFGNFKIEEIVKHGKRNYCKIVCVNNQEHIYEARHDSVKRGLLCKFCSSNPYYKTSTYNSWDSMLQRTRNPLSPSYYKYGAVGITCTEEWAIPGGVGFKNFLAAMGECPEGLTLDRWPDKAGNYEPGNVRWATNSEQGYNQKRRSTNTSGRTGVSWDERRGKWSATITFENSKVYLGRYVEFEDAVAAREAAELKYFGENKE